MSDPNLVEAVLRVNETLSFGVGAMIVLGMFNIFTVAFCAMFKK